MTNTGLSYNEEQDLKNMAEQDKEKGTFGLRFGVMVDPISTQLKDQGIKFNAEDVKHLQKDAEAVRRLRIRGLISLSAARALEQKIIKRVSKATTH